MSGSNDKSSSWFGGTSSVTAGFGQLGLASLSLRRQAEELTSKAASTVSELNAKVLDQKVRIPSSVHSPNNSSALLETPATKSDRKDGEQIDEKVIDTPSSLEENGTDHEETTASTPKSAQNISKEELLAMLQKMNKKVKALTQLRVQLEERVKVAEHDKTRLLSLIQKEILNEQVVNDSQGDNNTVLHEDVVAQLQAAWRAADERNSLALQQLQNEFKSFNLQHQEEMKRVKEAAEAEAQAKLEKIRAEAAAENLAASDGTWETMREQLVLRHEQELERLRKELELQREKELGQQKEIMEQRAQEAVQAAKAELQHVVDRKLAEAAQQPTADADARIEALQAQHAEEMAKLKQTASNQIQAFKTRVAGARAAELEKLKKEHAEAAEKELATKLTERSMEQQKELSALREQLQKQTEQILEKERHEAQLRLNQEVERVRNEFSQSRAQDMERLRMELTTRASNEQAMEIDQLRKSHEAELKRLELEASKLKSDGIEQARREVAEEVTSQLKEEFEKHIEELRSSHAQEFELLRSRNAEQLDQVAMKSAADAASKLHEQLALVRGEVDNLQKKLKTAAEEKAIALTVAMETHEEFKKRMEQQMSERKVAFDELIQAEKDRFSTEIERLNKELSDATQAGRKAESDAFSLQQQLNMLKESLDATHNDDVAVSEATAAQIAAREADFARKESQYQGQLLLAKKELEEVRNDANQRNAALDDSLLRATNMCKELETELAATKKELVETSGSASEFVQRYEETISTLTANLKAAQAEIQTISLSLQEANEKFSELEARNGNAQRSLEELQLKSTVERDAVREAESKLAEATSTINDLLADKAREIATLRAEFSSEKKRLAEELSFAQQALQELKQSREAGNAQLEQEIEKLRLENAEGHKINEARRKEYEVSLSNLRQQLSSLEAAVNARDEMLENKEVEVKELKDSYDAQLEAALKKQTAAVELVKKVKLASTQKLQAAEKEHAVALQNVNEERRRDMDHLKQDHERQLGEIRNEHENASIELRSHHEALLMSVQKEHATSIEILQNDRAAVEASLKDREEKILALLKERDEALAAAVTARQSVEGDEYKIKFKDAEERHHLALNTVEAEKQAAIEALRTEHVETLNKMSSDFSKKLNESLEAQKVEFTEQQRLLSQQHQLEVADLKKTFEAHVDRMEESFRKKVEAAQATHSSEIAKLLEENKSKEETLGKLAAKLKSLSQALTTLREEKESLQNKLKSEITTQEELKKNLNAKESELEETLANSSAAAASLLQRQEVLEQEKSELITKLAKTKSENGELTNKIEELTGKLDALSANLNFISEERKQLESKLHQASKHEAKLTSSEAEVNELRDQINKLKLEQAQSSSFLSRLQGERDSNERKHGELTKLVGLLETQLSEINEKNTDANARLEAAMYDLSQRDETVQELKEQLRKAEQEMAEVRNAKKEAKESLSAAQKGADAKKAKMVEVLQKDLQSLQQQMVKRSAAAQRLLQEKETECIELRKVNKALQQELDKGKFEDTHLLELAQKQSNRETSASGEIEIRDSIIARLNNIVVGRDGELAQAENEHHIVEGQMEQMCRVRRREDVNLDYLKSIIVQFLSKPPGSSERAALLPVIATLLQFDEADYQMIEQGKKKVSWWGNVTPIIIGSSAPTEPSNPTSSPYQPLSSAEVSISSPAATPVSGGIRTSLQF